MLEKTICALTLLLGVPSLAWSQSSESDYLHYVQTFADTLLATGLDQYGPETTAMWAAVMDTRDHSVPIRGVPPTHGVRPHDRAVGGANYYHDVVTLSVFDQLSHLTGNPRYRQAAQQYSQAFLQRTQHPETGLLGWGEHLFYHFYTDTVSIAESRILEQRGYFRMPHELIAWTPPWNRLWAEDSTRTRRAIEGLQYHFQGPDPQTYLFNRHAVWNQPQYQQEIMPWIKHSALYAYSYAFLYQQTEQERWKEKSWQIGTLYWNLRDHRTDLVFGCLYHGSKPSAGKQASLSGTASYAYWLYKAGELCQDTVMKQRAITLLTAYDRYAWHPSEKRYYNVLQLDGTVPPDTGWATPWKVGYGSTSLLTWARVVAYLAEREHSEALTQMAIRAIATTNQAQMLETFTTQHVGEAINANLDGYALTDDQQYVEHARRYADLAIAHLWRNGLFVRQKGDVYYEAKLGAGDLLSGLLRLHVALTDVDRRPLTEWSF